jgi:tetratricopeptide (TPR) repeat protein
MNRFHVRVARLALATLALASLEAHAFNFTPTEAEWATWPEMCKARYARTRIGSGSDFGTSVPPSVVQQWETQLGAGWNYVHHHCAGMIYLDRAKLESNASQRKFLLGKSISEHSFALEHTPAGNPLAAEIRTRLGLTYREMGDRVKAAEQFDAALKVNAAYGSAYVGKAMLDRDQSKLDAAIDTLRKGNEATSGQSAEISHFLALLLLQQGRYEESRTFARQAYANGYPLPGLRDRLARAGYPLD